MQIYKILESELNNVKEEYSTKKLLRKFENINFLDKKLEIFLEQLEKEKNKIISSYLNDILNIISDINNSGIKTANDLKINQSMFASIEDDINFFIKKSYYNDSYEKLNLNKLLKNYLNNFEMTMIDTNKNAKKILLEYASNKKIDVRIDNVIMSIIGLKKDDYSNKYYEKINGNNEFYTLEGNCLTMDSNRYNNIILQALDDKYVVRKNDNGINTKTVIYNDDMIAYCNQLTEDVILYDKLNKTVSIKKDGIPTFYKLNDLEDKKDLLTEQLKSISIQLFNIIERNELSNYRQMFR